MPLRDHFRSPVNDTHSWDECHGQWPGEIVRALTAILPAGFRAGPKVHLGSPFEVDVGSYDLDTRDPDAAPGSGSGGTATLTALAPTLTVETELTDQDEYEVRVYDTERGRTLVAAIELVSPANKDRADSRDAFVSKCHAMLQQHVCVVIVDPVTERPGNLWGELAQRLGAQPPAMGPCRCTRCAAARTSPTPACASRHGSTN